MRIAALGSLALLAFFIELLIRLFPVLDVLRKQAELLRLNTFQASLNHGRPGLVRRLPVTCTVSNPSRCAGYLDEIAPVAPGKGSGWRARGWAFDRKRSSVPGVDWAMLTAGLKRHPCRTRHPKDGVSSRSNSKWV